VNREHTSAGAAAVGALAALAVAAVVVRVASAYLDDQPWAGVLYLLCAVLLLIVGLDLWSPVRRRGMWWLGAAAGLGVVVIYLVSLAVGLPSGSERESWWDAWVGAGLLAMAVYVVAMTMWLSEDHLVRGRAGWHRGVVDLRR
jgi:peptidoglycan/LPS O-acetylase OafA/YrhL